MRKKGYYIHFNSRYQIGVSKKIDSQINVFQSHFVIEEIDINVKGNSILDKILCRLPFGYIKFDYVHALSKIVNPDFLYIRYFIFDGGFLQFLKSIKNSFPNCKIIVELFSYPYDRDIYLNRRRIVFLLKDIFNRKYLIKYVDRIVTYTLEESIFGIPTICVKNGVNVKNLKTEFAPEVNSKINVIAVAMMQKHHGFERFIEGMSNYYSKSNNEELVLHLIGDGPEINKYKNLVSKLSLGKYVKFYGKIIGEKLDEMMYSADYGLTSLGIYKIGHKWGGDFLKTSEYLSHGLMLINGCKIPSLNMFSNKFYIEFPNDRSVIDINDVVKHYKTITSEQLSVNNIKNEIHSFAKENFSISIVMSAIVNYIYL